jgi:hypothetical protein
MATVHAAAADWRAADYNLGAGTNNNREELYGCVHTTALAMQCLRLRTASLDRGCAWLAATHLRAVLVSFSLKLIVSMPGSLA